MHSSLYDTMLIDQGIKPGLLHGVYSYREAGRLLNVAHQRVQRWADGYTFAVKHGVKKSGPVLQSEHHPGVLTFEELIEMMFVRTYTIAKVPLPQIRNVALSLAQEVGPFPFTKKPLIVRGRELIIRNSEGLLHRPDIGQLVADFADSLVPLVDFNDGDESMSRYRPPEFNDEIYLDKGIRAGEPLVTEFGIPTRQIFTLWQQESNIEVVAEYFDIEEKSVSTAVRYEGQWRLAA